MKCDVKSIVKYFNVSSNKDKFYEILIKGYQPDGKVTSNEVADLECGCLTSGAKKKWMRLAFQIMGTERHTILGCRFLDALLHNPETEKEVQQREMLAVACTRVLEEIECGNSQFVRVISDGHKKSV